MGTQPNDPCSRAPASKCAMTKGAQGSDAEHLNMHLPSKPKRAQLRRVSLIHDTGTPRIRIKWLAQPSLRIHVSCRLASWRVAAIPRLLASVSHNLPGQVRPQLPVAYRTHGGQVGAEIPAVAQSPHLIEKPRRHHGAEAALQPLMQRGSVPGAEHPVAHRVALERTGGRALQLRNRPPGRADTPRAPAGCAGRPPGRCARRPADRGAASSACSAGQPSLAARASSCARSPARPPAAAPGRAAARAGRAWCRPPAAARAARAWIAAIAAQRVG